MKLNREIKKIKPDIVHCHSSKAGIIGRFVAKLNQVPKIFYSPHWYSFLSPEFSKKRRKFFIFIETIFSKYATTRTFCTSQGEKDAAILAKIDKEDKFKVVYNGLPKISIPSKRESLERLGLNSEAFFLGNVARMVPQKNPMLFFKMAKLISEKEKNVQFVWIGDGPLIDDVKQFVIDAGIEEKVHLYNYISDTESIVSAFDASFTTSNGEGFSYTTLESLRAGVPILSSNVMGNNEAIIPGINGGLFDSDKILNDMTEVFDFIKWSKNIDKAAIKQNFEERFPLHIMVNEITDEYMKNKRERAKDGFKEVSTIYNLEE